MPRLPCCRFVLGFVFAASLVSAPIRAEEALSLVATFADSVASTTRVNGSFRVKTATGKGRMAVFQFSPAAHENGLADLSIPIATTKEWQAFAVYWDRVKTASASDGDYFSSAAEDVIMLRKISGGQLEVGFAPVKADYAALVVLSPTDAERFDRMMETVGAYFGAAR